MSFMRLMRICLLVILFISQSITLPITARAGRVMVSPPVSGSSQVYAANMQGTLVPGYRGFITVVLFNLTATPQNIKLKIEASEMSLWGHAKGVATNHLNGWTKQSDPTQNCTASATTPLTGNCLRTLSLPEEPIQFALPGNARIQVRYRVQCGSNSGTCQYEVMGTGLTVTTGWTLKTAFSGEPSSGVAGCGLISSNNTDCLSGLGVSLSAGVRVEVVEDKGAVMGSLTVSTGVAYFGEATSEPYVLPLNAARAF